MEMSVYSHVLASEEERGGIGLVYSWTVIVLVGRNLKLAGSMSKGIT